MPQPHSSHPYSGLPKRESCERIFGLVQAASATDTLQKEGNSDLSVSDLCLPAQDPARSNWGCRLVTPNYRESYTSRHATRTLP
jgi:hypothetical protein